MLHRTGVDAAARFSREDGIAPVRRRTVVAAALVASAMVASGCVASTEPVEKVLSRTTIESSRLLAADGSLVTMLHGEVDRTTVPLNRIPKVVRNSVIASEDQRFWTHGGVDLRAIARAVLANASSSGPQAQVQGGSTITQQLVKNLYFAKPQRTIQRKVKEARLALSFEQTRTKREILALYLNTIYLGRSAYGVQSAAQAWFGVDVENLTLSQSAFLAGIIRTPRTHDWMQVPPGPLRDARYAKAVARRNFVLGRMRAQKFVSQAEVQAALVEPLESRTPSEQRWPHPYFVDTALRELGVLRSPGRSLDRRFDRLGKTDSERARRVYEDGLRIHTTMDPRVQLGAERAVAGILPSVDKMSASLVAAEPSTGQVRAVIGGRDYYAMGTSGARVNLALGTAGGGSGRQPGSSFKPIVLATALEQKLSLRNALDSSPFEHKFSGQVWKVANYEGNGRGAMDLRSATTHSVNAAYAHLLIDGIGEKDALKGAARVADTARRLGIRFPEPDRLKEDCGESYNKTDRCIPAEHVPAIALGAKEVSPWEMTQAYSAFAAEGRRHRLTTIRRIEDRNGKVLYEAEGKGEAAIAPGVAATVTDVLRDVIGQGTGTRARIDRPAAGKTGTSQQWRDAWFAGYTPNLAAVVWVGNPSEQESMVPSNDYPIKVVGGTYPARIWQSFMTVALAGVPEIGFPAPPPDQGKVVKTKKAPSAKRRTAPRPSPSVEPFPFDFPFEAPEREDFRRPRAPRTPRPRPGF